MRPFVILGLVSLGVTALVYAAGAAQPAVKTPVDSKSAIPATVAPQDDDFATPAAEPATGSTVFEQTLQVEPVAVGSGVKPAVLTSDGAAAHTGEAPMPVSVKETQPVGGNTAPLDNKPELSAPVASPEVVPVGPQTRYFVMIFGSESVPKRARNTHTWYTIIKATPKQEWGTHYDPHGEQIQYYDLLAHTISWLPASLRIRVLKFRADCGVNLALHPTLDYCLGNRECVAMWGPYEVNSAVAGELYDKSVKQIARLNSGKVMYKAIDPNSGPGALNISNCIHAVSDLDGPGRRGQYDELQRFGFDASANLVRVVAAANRVDVSVTHEWIAEALNLNRHPIQRRKAPVRTPAMQSPSVSPPTIEAPKPEVVLPGEPVAASIGK